jgi:hypothetical protein
MDHAALIESLELQVAHRGAELERLRIELEEELAGKHEAVTRAVEREESQQARIAALAGDVHRLSVELAEVQNHLAVTHASLSWRLTAPLRRLSALRRRA